MKKRRSIATSRAASLKGWRTRKLMVERRSVTPPPLYDVLMHTIVPRSVLDDMLPPERTINRIPKVEWP